MSSKITEAIPCSFCSRMICEDDDVTFYSQHNMHNAPAHARIIVPHHPVKPELAYVIGCTHAECMKTNRVRGQFKNGQIYSLHKEIPPYGIILWTDWLFLINKPFALSG